LKPDKKGILKKELVKRQKQTITDDYGKNAIFYIRKFKAFCLVPSHTDYKQIVGNCYNLYFELTHQPQAGGCANTLAMIKHIFGEKYELGLDYLQLLYTEPTQNLPILCLVSEERNTGKSTFGQWLIEIYGQNACKLGNQDLASDFNSTYAEKLVIVMDETSIEKKTISEAVKRMSTEQGQILVNAKNRQQYPVDFIGKFIFISNNEEDFIYIGKGENRYLVLKVPTLAQDDNQILSKLKNEIPAFLDFIKNRKLHYSNKSRMYFDFELLKTEQLDRVISASRTFAEKAVFEYLKETFEAYPYLTELKASLGDLVEELAHSYKNLSRIQIQDVLRKSFKLTPCKTARYEFHSLKLCSNNNEFLPEPLKRNNSYYLFKVQNFLDEKNLENRAKHQQNQNEYPLEWDK
jgi:hypothetical protein